MILEIKTGASFI